jgi:hypothetical protein
MSRDGIEELLPEVNVYKSLEEVYRHVNLDGIALLLSYCIDLSMRIKRV